MNKKSKIFIIIFFSLILIPVIVIGIVNYTKEQELNDRIENSRTTKTLSLNNITSSITLDELLEMETSKEYYIEEDTSADNEKMKKVTYTNTSMYGAKCEKTYVFYDDKLGFCIITIDTSHWMPKDIFTELSNINGEPDNSSLKEDKLGSDIYYWYGKNGTIVYTDDNVSNTAEIIFEMDK